MVDASGCFKWSGGGRKILAVDFQVLWIPVPLKLIAEGIYTSGVVDRLCDA